MIYKFSPSLSKSCIEKIKESGLRKALQNGTWADYLPTHKANKLDGMKTKLRILHFHLKPKTERKINESKEIVLFIIENNTAYIFHVSDTHAGFTKHDSNICPNGCQIHIKKAINTLIIEKELYCRQNYNMIHFHRKFFYDNTPKNSSTFPIQITNSEEITQKPSKHL